MNIIRMNTNKASASMSHREFENLNFNSVEFSGICGFDLHDLEFHILHSVHLFNSYDIIISYFTKNARIFGECLYAISWKDMIIYYLLTTTYSNSCTIALPNYLMKINVMYY